MIYFLCSKFVMLHQSNLKEEEALNSRIKLSFVQEKRIKDALIVLLLSTKLFLKREKPSYWMGDFDNWYSQDKIFKKYSCRASLREIPTV